MEIKLLILKGISFAYYRSYSTLGVTPSSQTLLTKVIKYSEVVFDENSLSRERNHLAKLHSLLKWMHNNDESYKYEITDLMSRIRIACGDNDRLYELFIQNILTTDSEAADNKVKSITEELTKEVARKELHEVMSKAWGDLRVNDGMGIDLSGWRTNFMSRLESLPLEGIRRMSTLGRMIDLSNEDDVAEVYEAAQAHIDPKMILPFPYQGLNDFTGPQQGLRRGDWSVHGALTGRNKTGVLIDTFCGWTLLKDPHLIEEGKKPTLVYVTIEDKVEEVFQKFYTVLKQFDHGLPVKITGVPHTEMAEYVKERMTRRGWNIYVFEFPVGGHNEEYLQIFRDLEDSGHEIIGVACDYVNLIGKQGIPSVVAGDEIKYLHRKLRGYFAPKAITHMTVHQLGPKAREAFRVDPVDYIRRLPGQGTFEGCGSLETEADFIFYLDKVQHGKIHWQQFQFDKHRRIGNLPDHLRYFAMKFLPFPMLNCKWDVLDDKPSNYDKVGATRMRPKVNFETLADVNADSAMGGDDFEDDFGF